MCNQVYIIQKSKNVFYVTFIANLRVTQLAHQGAHEPPAGGPGPGPPGPFRGPGPSNFWRVFRPVHGPGLKYGVDDMFESSPIENQKQKLK